VNVFAVFFANLKSSSNSAFFDTHNDFLGHSSTFCEL